MSIVITGGDIVELRIDPIDSLVLVIGGDAIGPDDSLLIEEHLQVLAIQLAANDARLGGAPVGHKQIALVGIQGDAARILNVRLLDDCSSHSAFVVNVGANHLDLRSISIDKVQMMIDLIEDDALDREQVRLHQHLGLHLFAVEAHAKYLVHRNVRPKDALVFAIKVGRNRIVQICARYQRGLCKLLVVERYH